MHFLSSEKRRELLATDCWAKDDIYAYENYLNRIAQKNSLARFGRTAHTDSERERTYRAEWAFDALCKQLHTEGYEFVEYASLEEVQDRCKTIINSKTWEKLCGYKKVVRVIYQKRHVRTGRRRVGRAWGSLIELNKHGGLTQRVLLHELAHCVGFMHHHAGFRVTLIKLVSAFMGVKYAKMLKKCYKDQGLKVTAPKPKLPKTPEEWMEMKIRMEKARAAKA